MMKNRVYRHNVTFGQKDVDPHPGKYPSKMRKVKEEKEYMNESIEQDLFYDVMSYISYFLTDEKSLISKIESQINFNAAKMRRKNQEEKVDTLINRIPQLVKSVSGKSNSELEKILIDLLGEKTIDEDRLEVRNFNRVDKLGLAYTEYGTPVFIKGDDINANPKEVKVGQNIDADIVNVGNSKYAKNIVPVREGAKDNNVLDVVSEVEKLIGGLADGSNDGEFDPEQLAMGIEVEKEHTNDSEVAKEVARDHLKEIPDYYTRLNDMERTAKQWNSKS